MLPYYLIPSVQYKLELGGGCGIEIAQDFQGLLLRGLHFAGSSLFGLIILSPTVVVVHVAFEGVFGMLSPLSLLIVLPLLFGRLIPARSRCPLLSCHCLR